MKKAFLTNVVSPSFVVVCVLLVMHSPLTAWADEVELVTGEVLRGRVVQQTPQRVILEHPVLGRVELGVDQIRDVRLYQDEAGVGHESEHLAEMGEQGTRDESVIQQTPSIDAVSKDDVSQQPAEGSPSTGVDTDTLPMTQANQQQNQQDEQHDDHEDWWARFDVGFNGTEGNTRTANLRLGFVAEKRTREDRFKFDAALFNATDRGRKTRNEFTVGSIVDWLEPESPWFRFMQGRFDFDEFASWEERISGSAGVGYQLYDTPDFGAVVRVGLGGAKEFGSVNEDFRSEASFGFEFTWQINDRMHLTAATTIYPDLTETGELRVNATGDWIIDIDEAKDIQLKLGIQNEYESDADPGVKKNDLKYYGALVFNF